MSLSLEDDTASTGDEDDAHAALLSALSGGRQRRDASSGELSGATVSTEDDDSDPFASTLPAHGASILDEPFARASRAASLRTELQTSKFSGAVVSAPGQDGGIACRSRCPTSAHDPACEDQSIGKRPSRPYMEPSSLPPWYAASRTRPADKSRSSPTDCSLPIESEPLYSSPVPLGASPQHMVQASYHQQVQHRLPQQASYTVHRLQQSQQQPWPRPPQPLQPEQPPHQALQQAERIAQPVQSLQPVQPVQSQQLQPEPQLQLPPPLSQAQACEPPQAVAPESLECSVSAEEKPQQLSQTASPSPPPRGPIAPSHISPEQLSSARLATAAQDVDAAQSAEPAHLEGTPWSGSARDAPVADDVELDLGLLLEDSISLTPPAPDVDHSPWQLSPSKASDASVEPAWLREASALLQLDATEEVPPDRVPDSESSSYSLPPASSSVITDLPVEARHTVADSPIPPSVKSLEFPDIALPSQAFLNPASQPACHIFSEPAPPPVQRVAEPLLSKKALGKLPMEAPEVEVACKAGTCDAAPADVRRCSSCSSACAAFAAASGASDVADPTPALQCSSGSYLRASLQTLSPTQRTALMDQATFFGANLRVAGAAVLCGGASKGLSSDTAAGALGASSTSGDVVPSQCESLLSCTPSNGLAASSDTLPSRRAACDETSQPTAQEVAVRRPTAERIAESTAAWLRFFRVAATRSRLLVRPWEVLRATGPRIHLAFNAIGALLGHIHRCCISPPLRWGAATVAAAFTVFASTVLSVLELSWNVLRPLLHLLLGSVMQPLRRIRRHRLGRHISNGAGAVVSVAAARTVILVGPMLGASLYPLLEALWIALGLTDLRILLLAMITLLLGLLQLYAKLGLFD